MTRRAVVTQAQIERGLRAAMLPRDVAERWQCSERHVRNLINRGELRHFRLGGKLVRIPISAVEEFEECQNSGSSPIEASSPWSGTRKGSASADPSEQTIVVTLDPRCNDLRPTMMRSDARNR